MKSSQHSWLEGSDVKMANKKDWPLQVVTLENEWTLQFDLFASKCYFGSSRLHVTAKGYAWQAIVVYFNIFSGFWESATPQLHKFFNLFISIQWTGDCFFCKVILSETKNKFFSPNDDPRLKFVYKQCNQILELISVTRFWN